MMKMMQAIRHFNYVASRSQMTAQYERGNYYEFYVSDCVSHSAFHTVNLRRPPEWPLMDFVHNNIISNDRQNAK